MHFEADPELLRPVDIPVLRGDHTRLTKATGWEPEIPIDRTLADLLEDWRTRVRADVPG
jgi:GDP-4-dehydro-6-deoxy-D-mannose reductase